ncbi:META and DUF4377 domain-containing protein [Thermomonas flagellata]|uniref:META and DUF4377 domain-containing protein n=1 Tax=Thermomonas flagellata TaxID=2888524 RepID=UPI001F03B359|nr:META and DUF4377 domain-containing protein [Thermomonas flagellata]
MHRWFILALSSLLLSACPRAPAPAAPGAGADTAQATALAEELPRYHWRLTDARASDGRRIDALFVRADAPLQLDFRGGRLAVSNACNRLVGGYALEGGQLVVARLAATMMACPDPAVMALDTQIGRRLEGTLAVTAQAGDPPRLQLRNAAGDTLVFAGAPTAQTRYGGPPTRIFLEVAAHDAPCAHPLIPNARCLQVRELEYDANGLRRGAPGPFQPFSGQIEGYTHADGIRNVLRIDRYDVPNPPADASRYAYVLDMVVESAREP